MPVESVFSAVLMDHYRRPRRYGSLLDPDLETDGANPLCGDEIHLQLKLDGDRVDDVAFTGHACAVCTASTSMFCEASKGLTTGEIEELKSLVHRLLRGESLTRDEKLKLGDILALEGVSKLPMRVKCALLVWETWGMLQPPSGTK